MKLVTVVAVAVALLCQYCACAVECLESQSEVDGALPVVVGSAACQFQKDSPKLFGGSIDNFGDGYWLNLVFWFGLGLIVTIVAFLTACCKCCCCCRSFCKPKPHNPDSHRSNKYKNTVGAVSVALHCVFCVSVSLILRHCLNRLAVTICVTLSACIIAFVANETLTSGISGEKGLTSTGLKAFDDGKTTLNSVINPVDKLIADSQANQVAIRNNTDNADAIFTSFAQARTDANTFCDNLHCAGSGWTSVAAQSFCDSLQAKLATADKDVIKPTQSAFGQARNQFLNVYDTIINVGTALSSLSLSLSLSPGFICTVLLDVRACVISASIWTASINRLTTARETSKHSLTSCHCSTTFASR